MLSFYSTLKKERVGIEEQILNKPSSIKSGIIKQEIVSERSRALNQVLQSNVLL